MLGSVFSSFLVAALALAPGVVAQNSPGCGKASKLKNGVNKINVGGTERQFILAVPDKNDNAKPKKLMFAFHWRGATMDNVVNDPTNLNKFYGLQAKAAGSAIFVAPDGLDKGWANDGGRDIRFVEAMIKAIEDDLCVDQAQRFAMGFSYGGGMSFSVACSLPTMFRAVAAQGAGEVSGCDGPKGAISYLGIQGINDAVLPLPGAIEIANKIAKANGCQANKNPETPAKGSKSFKVTNFTGCKKPVRFITFDGGHDTAPLGVANGLQADSMWDFFTKAA
ncbi:glycosyl hydrolase family 62 protein [Gaeumannomyces tritici R3-111a-1]|uniref:Feruloyl esterase C n=1 Tax=Gaeumannomyces tritici (strain R3-111a-1) TaxID=644352 RepID=J3P2B8_GAET3|nr:glycosyl hydrolase family 62 protein [Gaeumannomyces tritici R3-111a-1]EJT73810.1 glycosyl hydrolase family 62 protein [Gaeumannomyces tritici R3-111a-1]